MSARKDILARVRGATADVVSPMRSEKSFPVTEEVSSGPAETLELFLSLIHISEPTRPY